MPKKNIKSFNFKTDKGVEYRDSLIAKKHTDIDHQIAILNPHNTQHPHPHPAHPSPTSTVP